MAKTHTNPFSKEQILYLQSNKYVKSISQSTIVFTEEFKQYFYSHHKSGITARDIFIECGINPNIIGQSRFDGFLYTLNKNAKREEGFKDKRQHNRNRSYKSNELAFRSRIKRLEHELAYARQEIEFLKKMLMVNLGAQIPLV